MASGAGNLYASLTDVKSYLPADFANISEYSDALLTQDIQDASRTIDTRINRQYAVPFNAFNATPKTPEDIQTYTKMLASQYAKIRADRTDAPELDESGNSSLMRFVFAQLKDLNTNETQLAFSGTKPEKAYIAEIGSSS